jgi:trehalose 6-phosphate phosphatase
MRLDDLDADLRDALVALAAVPTLLVACDVDGTLAPIVDNPPDAVVDVDALAALNALAHLPRTTVALVSGRPLRDLRAMTMLGPEVLLVGSHGAEHGDYAEVPRVTALALEQVLREVRAIADDVPGVLLEEKATGVAVHVRRAERDVAARVTAEVVAGPSTLPGVRTTHGKEVVELSVVDADKGRALDRLREESGADAVVYAGDDITDEWAFASLGAGDVGIKVGPGETGARFRVPTTRSMAPLLALLAEARAGRVPD